MALPIKTYGTMDFDISTDEWIINAQPHVVIKLKHVFPQIPKTVVSEIKLKDRPDTALDLDWFILRYPLIMTDFARVELDRRKTGFIEEQGAKEQILLPDYTPQITQMKIPAYPEQEVAVDFLLKTKRFLLGDAVGKGKTTVAIAAACRGLLPMLVVVQSHLPGQWLERIRKFSSLSVHIIKGRKPYSLPPADVYIVSYSCVAAWSPVLCQPGFLKISVFDEMQEVRRAGSDKSIACKQIAAVTPYAMGMTATPIYNYADELYTVLNMLKPGCLGEWEDFYREWFAHGQKIKDPVALGTYLRDNHLVLRRGRPVNGDNKIYSETVECNSKSFESVYELAKVLAQKTQTGMFVERGQAARELDMMVRKATGVSKAKGVAQYAKIFLENKEPIILVGWHRDVYDIWLEELKEYNPLMYTGSESTKQKEEAVRKFCAGESDLFILSLRSGAGIDGLQYRCRTMLIGELDWSPKVHEQLFGRIDRPGGEGPITGIYLTCDEGSDPPIVELLGLKNSQSTAIMDPYILDAAFFEDQEPDGGPDHKTRVKMLAEAILKR